MGDETGGNGDDEEEEEPTMQAKQKGPRCVRLLLTSINLPTVLYLVHDLGQC